MRFSQVVLFMVLVFTLAAVAEAPPLSGATESCQPYESPVCFRRNRHSLMCRHHAFAFAVQEPMGDPKFEKFRAVNINWPYGMDNLTLDTFEACGSADTEYVWGLILDDSEPNWIWPGTTTDSSWKIIFTTIPREENKELRLRVEEVDNGELISDDTIFKIDFATGKFTEECSRHRIPVRKSEPPGKKLKITSATYDKDKKVVKVEGETSEAGYVYGMLVPSKTKKFRPILADQMVMGKTWTMEIKTHRAPKDEYQVRVRHASTKKGQHIYWDKWKDTIKIP